MFKQRKHKRFNYRPRFQDSEPVDSHTDFETKWAIERETNRKRGNVLTSLPVLIIALICIIVLMFVLEGYITS